MAKANHTPRASAQTQKPLHVQALEQAGGDVGKASAILYESALQNIATLGANVQKTLSRLSVDLERSVEQIVGGLRNAQAGLQEVQAAQLEAKAAEKPTVSLREKNGAVKVAAK